MVKIAFLTLLFDDRLYMMVSETEMDHGYIDLSLIVRPDQRRAQALDLLLEFKYVSLKDLKLSGEQAREKRGRNWRRCRRLRRNWRRRRIRRGAMARR